MPGDAADLGGGFRRIAEEEVFRGHVFSVAHLRLEDPDGEQFERDVVRHPGAVAVVPVHGDATATLVRQLRPAVAGSVLEIPAGTCDVAGEAPEETARRELAEEAGYLAAEVRLLAGIYNSPGYDDQRTLIFLATGLSPCDTGRTGVEERWMSLETVALADVEELASSGRLVDATTIAGLLLARSALGGQSAGA